MDTNALAFHDLMKEVAQQTPDTLKFYESIGAVLGVEDDQIHEAIGAVVRLLTCVETDIEGLPFPEDQKRLLRSQVKVFSSLKSYSHFGSTLKDIKNRMLKPENFIGLMNVHMATAAYANTPTFDGQIDEAVDGLRALREQVSKLDIPSHLKVNLLMRLNQVLIALDHYKVFGALDLNAKIDGLIGQLGVQSQISQGEEEQKFYKKALNVAATIYNKIKFANGAYEVGKVSYQNANEFLGVIDEFKDII